MTTRDELHALVDAIALEELEAAGRLLLPLAGHGEAFAVPITLGAGHSHHGGLSERVDDLLAEGFGGR